MLTIQKKKFDKMCDIVYKAQSDFKVVKFDQLPECEKEKYRKAVRAVLSSMGRKWRETCEVKKDCFAYDSEECKCNALRNLYCGFEDCGFYKEKTNDSK